MLSLWMADEVFFIHLDLLFFFFFCFVLLKIHGVLDVGLTNASINMLSSLSPHNRTGTHCTVCDCLG